MGILDAPPRRSVAVGVLGQSNEKGAVALSDKAAYPQAFRSLRRPSVRVPIGPSVSASGGYWCKVHDDLYDAGYDPVIVNGAIGSLSFIRHAAGQIQGWGAGGIYYRRRLPSNNLDRGYAGDFMSPEGGTVWQCVAGNDMYAMSAGPDLTAGAGYGWGISDFITQMPGGRDAVFKNYVTSAVKPTFPTNQPFGYTLTEVPTSNSNLGVVWKFIGYANNAPANGSGMMIGTGICTEAQVGVGFDPFGVVHRLHEEMQRVKADRKIIYICNGQSDAGFPSANYKLALQSLGAFYLARGYEVMIGFTNYSPGTPTTGGDGWPAMVTAKNNAITYLQGTSDGARCYAGADLYTLMGTTGPMAAGGAFMQSGDVHINGAGAVGPAVSGVSCAGKYVSDSIKTVLAQPAPTS
jgi:hypothetical protein